MLDDSATWFGEMPLVSKFLDAYDQGRVANTRPVATIEKWATGRVMQRLFSRDRSVTARPFSDFVVCAGSKLLSSI